MAIIKIIIIFFIVFYLLFLLVDQNAGQFLYK